MTLCSAITVNDFTNWSQDATLDFFYTFSQEWGWVKVSGKHKTSHYPRRTLLDGTRAHSEPFN